MEKEFLDLQTSVGDKWDCGQKFFFETDQAISDKNTGSMAGTVGP